MKTSYIEPGWWDFFSCPDQIEEILDHHEITDLSRLSYACLSCGLIGISIGDQTDRDEWVANKLMLGEFDPCCGRGIYFQSVPPTGNITAQAVSAVARALAAPWVDDDYMSSPDTMPYIKYRWDGRNLPVIIWSGGPDGWTDCPEEIVGVAQELETYWLFVEPVNLNVMGVYDK